MAVNGDPQDGIDAGQRARSEYHPDWHPVLLAEEVRPGEWLMVSQYGTRYAVILLLQIGGERGYRAVTWAEASTGRTLIGYYRTLRAACFAAHRRWLEQLGRPGAPVSRMR